jgi:hypothetical protein
VGNPKKYTTFPRLLKFSLLTCLLFILTFLTAEYSYRYAENWRSKIDFRTMLFQKGDNFKNIDSFFTYHPNKEIRSATLYSKKIPKNIKDIVLEYDYIIKTNNAGLVMSDEINNGDEVFLIIGDSFTEGQGADPWFYDFEKNSYLKIKPVNMGILGTGPVQWLELTNYMIKTYNLKVQGIIVNLILPDLDRGMWNFNEFQITCLKNAECPYRGDFQGFDFEENKYKNEEDLKKYILSRSSLPLPSHLDGNIDEKFYIKKLLKKSKIYNELLAPLKYQYIDDDAVYQRNISALKNLILISDYKIFINIINTKDHVEIRTYEKNQTLNKFLKFLEKEKINHKWCWLKQDYFHIHDVHPNKIGYQHLLSCTLDASLNLLSNK